MSFVLGVTGGIGSGKTAVTDHFASLGVDIIDADIIAHQLVEPTTPALKTITEHFGASVLLSNGELDRTKLRNIIFNDKKEKNWLENFLHPLIRKTIQEKIQAAKPPYCILVAPLLLEGSLHTIASKIAVVDCSEATQIKRATARDNTTKESIQSIIEQQMSRDDKLSKADFVMNNEGSIAELHQQVNTLHQQILQSL